MIRSTVVKTEHFNVFYLTWCNLLDDCVSLCLTTAGCMNHQRRENPFDFILICNVFPVPYR